MLVLLMTATHEAEALEKTLREVRNIANWN